MTQAQTKSGHRVTVTASVTSGEGGIRTPESPFGP